MMTANGLAKLLEEMGTLTQDVSLKIGFLNTATPEGDTILDRRVENGIADVMAACAFVSKALALNDKRMLARAEAKLLKFEHWHAVDSTAAESFHG